MKPKELRSLTKEELVQKEKTLKEELFKLIASPYSYEGIILLRNSGLLDEIIP